jgi:enoyl-CoA hydratase
MNRAFFQELKRIIEEFERDDGVRVILLTAEGTCFSSGLDLIDAVSWMHDSTTKGRHEFKTMIMKELQDSFSIIERCRKPVIAAINGPCIGGGVDLVCACDIRLASKDAFFSIREVRMAMVADLGTLQRLPKLIGESHTRELALTGRDFTAEEALAMGFVTHVYKNKEEMLSEARGMAEKIAELSPTVVEDVKETLNFSRDHDVAAGLEYVAQKNTALLPSEDLMEAFQAFLEKRKPQFTGK